MIIFLMLTQFNLSATEYFNFPEGISVEEKEFIIEQCSGFIPAFCHDPSMMDDSICDLAHETTLLDECMMDILNHY